MSDLKTALEDAKFEASCMELDVRDALASKSVSEVSDHLQAAIIRHATMARHLRAALTTVALRRGTLSMTYPASLGGGHGPDRTR